MECKVSGHDLQRMVLSETPSNPTLVVCLKDTARLTTRTASAAMIRSKTKFSHRWVQLSI